MECGWNARVKGSCMGFGGKRCIRTYRDRAFALVFFFFCTNGSRNLSGMGEKMGEKYSCYRTVSIWRVPNFWHHGSHSSCLRPFHPTINRSLAAPCVLDRGLASCRGRGKAASVDWSRASIVPRSGRNPRSRGTSQHWSCGPAAAEQRVL